MNISHPPYPFSLPYSPSLPTVPVVEEWQPLHHPSWQQYGVQAISLFPSYHSQEEWQQLYRVPVEERLREE